MTYLYLFSRTEFKQLFLKCIYILISLSIVRKTYISWKYNKIVIMLPNFLLIMNKESYSQKITKHYQIITAAI